MDSPRVGRGRSSKESPRQTMAMGKVWLRLGPPDPGVPLVARIEITKKCAAAYEGASKRDKPRILDPLVEVTWRDRDYARQELKRRLKQVPGRAVATVAVIDT